ncbi:hypothetical protein GCM10010844_00180 [Deinococcus radiotolerans]|uniref:Uncharacterized protein n=1 Tax=Deinococcus radiotolerans TaxID=1309407 RepID=A0ABQ2FFJ2_9DEIO|nr:hypothetical protein GCM10010844_00180 [Deinococcus radiotolerans]
MCLAGTKDLTRVTVMILASARKISAMSAEIWVNRGEELVQAGEPQNSATSPRNAAIGKVVRTPPHSPRGQACEAHAGTRERQGTESGPQ